MDSWEREREREKKERKRERKNESDWKRVTKAYRSIGITTYNIYGIAQYIRVYMYSNSIRLKEFRKSEEKTDKSYKNT